MKDTKQIIEDLGLGPKSLLPWTLEQILNGNYIGSTHFEGVLYEIIGALYRRIEKLEEEKECHIAEIKALESAVAGNAERIAKLDEENASFIKDLKLQSERLAELETWNGENQGV